jgi:hypothetical protein
MAQADMEDPHTVASESITARGVARTSVALVALLTGIFLLFRVADRFHLDLEAVPVMLAGVTVLVLCHFRPSWFWDSWRGALLLRQQWGDSVALLLYVLLAAGLLGLGGVRQLLSVEDLRTCQALYEAAKDSHQRVKALRTVPRPAIPSVLRFLAPYRARTCERYVTVGAL